ncbi:MAG: hypothetical protein WKG06_47795 [Segetibacter sp.]
MRTIHQLGSIALALILILTACKKDKNPGSKISGEVSTCKQTVLKTKLFITPEWKMVMLLKPKE